MTLAELWEALDPYNVLLGVHAGKLVVQAAKPLPDALMDALRLHKAAVVALLRTWGERGAPVPTGALPAPQRVCRTCGGTTFWQLPSAVGPGWRCEGCHPQPDGYKGEARKRWESRAVVSR